ncbi:4-hydroxy-3-methylbut-2-en-1-yl diphosphate synthase (flavodoxin) [Candidatus Kuenenia stuttgartiensis]|uniref:4-hydroxy-3-methylbut-2-en-1-yl diphosphate synthase (flavodoxin) n=1 Tax=Kuenenia stuttgartiensis TaxID=174633 RepID=Q1PZ18_KUEST|nr:flavodoxin-dependent (E)-4-hydroxy-3-methylbut-2-enyl-diphosphate synthase [Candidatus Kuenenia stuttgartiensis]MCF6151785.1 flavodoxin-dependent (E)-4-hydroxy-3-methylbut-2-enyl-diphosphate synthase [Candidatus Kuenenia stuttgartiensis]QII10300.1 4-hydroxy-3-methylbut-2-en-1-yl diphosphate synthase (flavodoxin) [Candidatus Kuenenia stuttgartiensis]TVL97021.1 MAG: 4-hydroxy-3-methylbut-2-en-1-yl diphosphate synthase [Candidatus Kuenenia stuttgartiensis]CAJ72335.1 similar to 4-hydroxy-3-methy
MIKRRNTRTVNVGGVLMGGNSPISVQTMTKTHTEDIDATVKQIKALEAAGCNIVRVAVPTIVTAKCLGAIKRQINIPLVADIHFGHHLALEAISQGVDKIRINPGNMKDRKKLEEIIKAAKEKGIPIRIGVNSGSIRDVGIHEELTALMVKTVLQYCEHFESIGFRDIVLSLKASDVPSTLEAYRSIATQCDYPLHLGVTAAGPPSLATIKSAIGIGGLLSEGIGDTLRVSYTGASELEVEAGFDILEALGLYKRRRADLISCPTCGRCEIDLVKIVEQVRHRLPNDKKHLQIAIMGCIVNGPGEAREVDIGIAGGKGFGFLFKKGEKVRKIPEDRMVDELLEEISLMK